MLAIRVHIKNHKGVIVVGITIKKVVIVPIALLVILLVFMVIKYAFLGAGLYKSNSSLDKEENKGIKSLLLNVIKKRHSALISVDEGKLFAEEACLAHASNENLSAAKSIFIKIDSNFMDSVEKTNENEYKAKLQMRFPDDWCYYFVIEVIDAQYFVAHLEIDP